MSFLDLFGELARRYYQDGFVFFIVHLVVLGSVVASLVGIVQETLALRRWNAGTTDGKSDVIGALGQFVTESRKLGPLGMFVPMTDFSDRLDAIVEGRIGELYDRINLLLLVGIAGTLFGLFEFSVRAVEVLNRVGQAPEVRIAGLGKALSEGLAKAFPVAFVGLALMLLFQLLASFPERRLRSALAGATRRALDVRREVSASQASIVDRVGQRIETALQPLADLKGFLAESLTPVIAELGKRLDSSLSLVRAQFTELETTTSGFRSAVDSLRGTVDSLGVRTEAMGSLMEGAPAILEKLGKAQERQEAAAVQRDASLVQSLEEAQKTTQALAAIVREVEGLPARISSVTQVGVDKAVRGASDTWLEIAQTLRQALEGETQRLSEVVGFQLGEVKKAGTDTAKALQELTVQGTKAVAGWEGLSESVGTQLKEIFVTLGQSSAQSWKEVADRLSSAAQGDLLRFVDQMSKSSEAAASAMGKAGEEWKRLAFNAEGLIREPLLEAAKALRSELATGFDEILRKYPEAASRVEGLTRELGELVVRVEQVRHAFEASKAASVQAPPSPSDSGSTALLREIRDHLATTLAAQDREIRLARSEAATARELLAQLANRPAPQAVPRPPAPPEPIAVPARPRPAMPDRQQAAPSRHRFLDFWFNLFGGRRK